MEEHPKTKRSQCLESVNCTEIFANALRLPFLSADILLRSSWMCSQCGSCGVDIVIYLARIFVVGRPLCSIRVLVSRVANFVDTRHALTA